MRRSDLTERALAGLLALGLVLGAAPRALGAEAGTPEAIPTSPVEEPSAPEGSAGESAGPEPAAPASAEQYLAALDRLLALGLCQQEADSLWLRLGAAGIETCLQGEGAPERLSSGRALLSRSVWAVIRRSWTGLRTSPPRRRWSG